MSMNSIKNWIFLLIIILLAVFEATILDYFKIFGAKPDLLLASIVFASLYFAWKQAIAFSIFAGILKDALGINTFGVNTLFFPLWVIAIIQLSKKISIDNNFVRLAIIFVIAIFHNILIRLINLPLGSFIPFGVFLRILLLQSIYTTAVSLFYFRLIK